MRWLTAGILLMTMEVMAAGDVRLRIADNVPDTFREALAARVAGLQSVSGQESSAQAWLVRGAMPQERIVPVFAYHLPYRVLLECQQECSGVAREPDPSDQLWLLRRLLPQARRVGVLLHSDNGWQRDRLDQAAGALSLALKYAEISEESELGEALSSLLPRVDALLLLPDERLFNASTAKLILLSSYRQDRPVIGPDERFVQVGSLASVYIREESVVEVMANLVHRWIGRERMPGPRFAEGTVSINDHVARSYEGLPVDQLDQLQRELEERP